MLVNTYNQKGEKTEQIELPKEIFGKEFKPDLIHQVVVSMQSSQRQGTAHAKNRSEVRGGGKKPWRQKGTGRARHGSTRSPIWIGGGVTFGPTKDRNYKKSIPKKMRRAALLSTLSAKAKDKEIAIIDEIKIKQGISSGPPRFGPKKGNEILWASTIRQAKKNWNARVDSYNKRCPRKIGRRFSL